MVRLVLSVENTMGDKMEVVVVFPSGSKMTAKATAITNAF